MPTPHGEPVAHSLTSTQVADRPVPMSTYPGPHEHVKPPAVLLHVFVAERLRPHAVGAVHSFVSTHVSDRVPDPVSVYPVVHEHEKPPVLFVHVLLADRLRPHAVAAAHSSVSTHVSVAPLPCDW